MTAKQSISTRQSVSNAPKPRRVKNAMWRIWMVSCDLKDREAVSRELGIPRRSLSRMMSRDPTKLERLAMLAVWYRQGKGLTVAIAVTPPWKV